MISLKLIFYMIFLYVYQSFCRTVKVQMTAIRQILCRVCVWKHHAVKILHSIHRPGMHILIDAEHLYKYTAVKTVTYVKNGHSFKKNKRGNLFFLKYDVRSDQTVSVTHPGSLYITCLHGSHILSTGVTLHLP